MVLFPVVIKAQKNMVALNNVLPESQRRQMQTMDSNLSVDESKFIAIQTSTQVCYFISKNYHITNVITHFMNFILGLRARREYKQFMAENNIHPVLTYLPMICQASVFMSM
jgi:hypothetical protein